ncbi:MAG: protein of unknown function DUF1828 [Saliniramus fredricksonii]|uniref:DUF1828 domain-containing protein n=1 Tax=Saliniramus fredricksonii TaxID=1653334 RepID=A0A0N8KEV1_9HYPH|nr:DUF1828 domain-containing protein [Saliniramus fredricksonii]KPQ12362.1 MAG: protein of unknown function DUF1828 [Saliniramus fredricksonii]SCC81264.1 protein of unknown function DUF1828 [Saliniramus fredricksonii]
MNLQKEICAAFCDGLVVREVPVGYAISTPVTWFSGDTLSFFARVEGARARLEDSGSLLFDLEGQGVDFSSENRMEILSSLMDEHGVTLSEEDGLFCTEWVAKGDIAKLVLPFIAFLTRVQDLLFLNREVVRSTFREDLISALEDTFSENRVSLSEALIPNLPHYTVDVVVRAPSGKIAAIFPATNDVTVLRAVLFSMEVQKHNISDIVPFLIYENLDRGAITQQSREIAVNSDLTPAVWSGGRGEVMEKVRRYVQ